MFPRLFAASRKLHIDACLARRLVEIGNVAAFNRRLKRRVYWAKHDFVRFGKGRGKIRKERLSARIAVRLKKNTQDSAADLPRHRDCTRHLRRVVRVVGVYAVY